MLAFNHLSPISSFSLFHTLSPWIIDQSVSSPRQTRWNNCLQFKSQSVALWEVSGERGRTKSKDSCAYSRCKRRPFLGRWPAHSHSFILSPSSLILYFFITCLQSMCAKQKSPDFNRTSHLKVSFTSRQHDYSVFSFFLFLSSLYKYKCTDRFKWKSKNRENG